LPADRLAPAAERQRRLDLAAVDALVLEKQHQLGLDPPGGAELALVDRRGFDRVVLPVKDRRGVREVTLDKTCPAFAISLLEVELAGFTSHFSGGLENAGFLRLHDRNATLVSSM
jgi:hypothetical protein